MKAIICNKPREFEKIELQDPAPVDGEVIVKIKKIAIKGIPAGCIGVKIDVLIESRMFIYFPVEILF